MARNAVFVPISQGTEATIVTEYVPFRDYTHTASKTLYGNQSNHAVLWCGTTQTQDSRGIRPRGVCRIHQAQGEPRGSSMARVSSHKDTWCQYSLWKDQAKEEAWTMLVKWTRKIAIKQKGLWPAPQGHPGCKTLQMWMARTSRPHHKSLTWTKKVVRQRAESLRDEAALVISLWHHGPAVWAY